MRIKKGLNLPIEGAPNAQIDRHALEATQVAVSGRDYWGLKPKMLVQEGDRVQMGQPLFADKTFSDIVFTAPATGQVSAINRGVKRFLESVVIDVDRAAEEADDVCQFTAYPFAGLKNINTEQAREQLLASGLWPQIRTRPYSKLANPAQKPMAFFINLMNTEPLSFDPALALEGREQDFLAGLLVVSALCDGTIFVCKSPKTTLPEGVAAMDRVEVHEFSGPHPAGLVGTHIHYLAPVNAEKVVWHLDAQDLLAFGQLFQTGRYPKDILVAVAGPIVKRPRVMATRRGACVSALANSEIDYTKAGGHPRVVSGSLLTGRQAKGFQDYLGAFHRQISIIAEYGPKRLLGWLIPGWDRFATARVHLSSLSLPKKYNMSASANGSPRAMVPFGLYEEVVPLDILPTQLLRALLVLDTDTAQSLGALELDEEDLALCSYVCLSKYEYGTALRAALTRIEAEG